ncbi:MAG: VOC family protein [Cyanobacteria bacterium J06629_2]
MRTRLQLLIVFLMFLGCSNSELVEQQQAQNEELQTRIDSLQTLITENMPNTSKQITAFLTFQENNAEEAMNYYVALFDNSEVLDIQRHGAGGPAPEGSILLARFSLNGMEVLCSDSYIKHEWDFTPGVSLFVTCQSAEEQDKLFERLSADGQVMMPLNNYGFSQRFGFVEDQFGISWQLNLD